MFRRRLTLTVARISTKERLVPGEGAWLLYGGRMLANVPTSVTITPEVSDVDPLDFVVKLDIDIVDGRLACVSLAAERLPTGPPITSEGLRRVPVAEYVVAAAIYGAGILRERIRQPDGSHREVPFKAPPQDFTAQGMTDEALEHVARIYAMAQATGRKATGILLNDYGMPRPTATRWIQAARRRGILREEHRRMKAGDDFGVQPTAVMEAARGQR